VRRESKVRFMEGDSIDLSCYFFALF